MPKRKITKRDITEEQFFKILTKAAQPLPVESDLAPLETLDILPDDDYNETDTRLNRAVDTSG